VDLALPEEREPDRAYAEGPWHAELKYLESAGAGPAALHLRYSAAEANLVLAPAGPEPLLVEIAMDGAAPAPGERAEAPAQGPQGSGLIRVDRPRLYRLVRHPEHGTHELRLEVAGPGLRAYVFTFVAGLAK
jgi:hypothetical protein